MNLMIKLIGWFPWVTIFYLMLVYLSATSFSSLWLALAIILDVIGWIADIIT